jgi:hypothetical protein
LCQNRNFVSPFFRRKYFPNLNIDPRLSIPETEVEAAPEESGAKARSYVLSFPQSFAVSEEALPERICLQVDTWKMFLPNYKLSFHFFTNSIFYEFSFFAHNFIFTSNQTFFWIFTNFLKTTLQGCCEAVITT